MMSKREIRTMQPVNVVERKEGEEPNYYVEGYASTFNEYELYEKGGKHYCEKIERDAFDDCDFTDCVFRVDHQGPVFARFSNGAVELSVDDGGLKQRTNLGLTDKAKALYDEIRVGNYPQMSFAFTVEKYHIERSDKNKLVRIIEKVGKLFDVSPVTWPANPFTDISVSPRAAFEEFESAELQELEQRAKEEELEAVKAELRKKLNKEV